MGTTWNVQIAGTQGAPATAMGEQLQSSLERLDRKIFSTYSATSELSLLNETAMGVPVNVSPELLEVLVLARTLNVDSQGAFDITVGPLVNLWGFGPDGPATLPTDEAIQAARNRLGMQYLQLDVDRGIVIRQHDIQLDLSAIAKGYAVDVIAEQLEAAGLHDYLVEIGGEIRVSGNKGRDQSWQIAIETPTDGPRQAYLTLANNNQPMALAGSGDYRNYREWNAARYSHEIDPRTGKPITHTLAAVTVVAQSAALADAWATALFVQGPEEGLSMANSLGLAAYFIMHADQGLVSGSSQLFKERFGR